MFHDQPWVRYATQHGPTLPKEGLSRPLNGLGDDWIKALEAKQQKSSASEKDGKDGSSGEGAGRRKRRKGGSFVRGPAYLHYKVVDPDPSQ